MPMAGGVFMSIGWQCFIKFSAIQVVIGTRRGEVWCYLSACPLAPMLVPWPQCSSPGPNACPLAPMLSSWPQCSSPGPTARPLAPLLVPWPQPGPNACLLRSHLWFYLPGHQPRLASAFSPSHDCDNCSCAAPFAELATYLSRSCRNV